jgi:hypothetical protein
MLTFTMLDCRSHKISSSSAFRTKWGSARQRGGLEAVIFIYKPVYMYIKTSFFPVLCEVKTLWYSIKSISEVFSQFDVKIRDVKFDNLVFFSFQHFWKSTFCC